MSYINFTNDEINDFEANHANLLESLHTVLYYHKRFKPVLQGIAKEYDEFLETVRDTKNFRTPEGRWDPEAEERGFNEFAYHLGCDYRSKIYDKLNEKFSESLSEDKLVAEGVYQFILQFDKMFDSWETLGHIALGNECMRVARRYMDDLVEEAYIQAEASMA